MSDSPALAGLRVLDLSSVGPAARCARVLADYGARVIKVGPTSARRGVQIRPPFFSYGAGRGMERVQIDLKSDAGRAAFLNLARGADAVIESFRPGVAARLGIGFEAVKAENPKIVYCSTSGYGQDGPYAQWAGHDINYLGLGGFLACSSPRADGGPPIPGATVADSAAGGMHAAIAILAALRRRDETGAGAWLDVSVAEGVLHLMALHIDEHLATGAQSGPGSNILTGRYACYDTYRCRDGSWLAVGAIEPAFFANLCKALDLEQWIPHQNDDERQDEIRTAFRQAFASRDRDAWMAELGPANTCVTPAYSVAEAVLDPHFQSRRVWLEARDAEHGSFRQVGPVLAGGVREQGAHEVRSADETDTVSLLREAGMSEREVAALCEQGVIE